MTDITRIPAAPGNGGTWYRTEYATIGAWGERTIRLRSTQQPGIDDFSSAYNVQIIAPDGNGGHFILKSTQVGDADISIDFGETEMAGYIWIKVNSLSILPTYIDVLDLYTPDDTPPSAGKEIDSNVLDVYNISDYSMNVCTAFDVAQNTGSPLVLDLDGDGVELTALDSTGAVYWDIDQDGFGEASAWVGPDDGLLAIDRDGDGLIANNNELFGTLTTDGFSVLRTFDTNADQQITAADAQFSSLLIWQDANGDGYSDAGELHTLIDLGITSISLGATILTDMEIAGNPISHASSFTMNGNSYEIVDAWFNYNQTNSVYQGDWLIDVRTVNLPELRGYGDLKALSVAMSDNENLLELVDDVASFSLLDALNPLNEFDAKITDVMFEWAGITDIPLDSRGLAMGDARYLEFVEAFVGQDYRQGGIGGSPDPRTVAAYAVRQTFSTAHRGISARILFQIGGDELLTGDPRYDALSDEIVGATGIDLTALQTVIDDLGLQGGALQTPLVNILNMIDQAIDLDTLSTQDAQNLQGIVEAALDSTASYDDIKGFARGYIYGLDYNSQLANGIQGTEGDDAISGFQNRDYVQAGSGNDTVYGNDGRDVIEGENGNDQLYGGAGHDEIYGGQGNDTLHGGSDDDYLLGGTGDDTYIYTSGLDILLDSGGVDEIVMPTGYQLSDMRLEYGGEGDNDLYIYFNDVLTLIIERFVTFASDKIEYITFADTTTFDFIQEIAQTVEGTDQSDQLVGFDRAYLLDDIVQAYEGDDDLTGGLGHNLLYGGSGNDTYFVGPGFDVIQDIEYDSADTIRFGAGVAAGDIRLETDVNAQDLLIYVSDVLKVRVVSQFSGYGSLEYISLNGVSTINLMTTVTTQVGTATEDYITGIAQGGPTANIINAMGGNDVVMAGDGDDVINGGAGDDALNGGEGNDSYVYDLSYNAGFDTVIDLGGTADVISVNTSLASANLSFSRNEVNNLIVNLGGKQAMLLAGFFQTQGRIESIVFTDQTLSLNSIVNILGTSANETLNGDASALFGDDLIFGYGGNDTLNGLTGGDVLYGGDGTDTINGGDGNDTLFGEAGADTLDGGAGDDVMEGGAAADTYLYSAGSDTIREIANGGGVNDILKFGNGITLANLTFVRDLALDYTGNNLWVNQGSNSTQIEGQFTGTGIETLQFADNSTSSLTGVRVQTLGSGFGDTIYGLIGYSETINGGEGTDEIYADDGNDVLLGGAGTDILYGGTGNDILDGEAGVDTLDGQAGHDVYYVGAGDVVLESGNNDNDLYLISAAATGSYSITDNGGSNDALYITLLASQSYTFTSDGSSLSINLISGSDTATITITSQYGALPESIVERIIFGSFAGNVNTYDGTFTHTGGFVMTENGLSQTVTYTAAAETINGSTSALVSDNINAAGGNDIVYGFAGADYVYAGDGNDYVYGGDDNDTLFGEAGDDVVSGEAGDDTLWGGAGVDYLWGNTGNDTLYGEAGADALRGLEGDDIIWGGNDNDNIRGDDVDSLANFSGAGNDELHGGSGNDNIAGGAGDDVLYGDAGQDTLWGNAGADTFKFDASSNAMDYVMDYNWQSEVDIIDISGVFNESYDVLSSLSSFVQLQALSAHTRIQVDRDGSGSAFGWENVAQLQGQTGLNLNTLVSNGALIVD